jgi:hypothetical protein
MKKEISKGLVIVNGNWKEEISEKFDLCDDDYYQTSFLDTIWEVSLTAFDIPREVQVVIDADLNLYMSVGNPGFVWFDEPPVGLSLPLRCWIHTHPFGKAYFSHTDWKTIRTWESELEEAIVLGDREAMSWVKGEEHTIHYAQCEIPEWVPEQMTLDDFGEEE